jgi:hypothetical protein
MVEAVYILCFFTSAAVAFLLLRGFARGRERILAWTGLGFVALSLNNAVLILDRMILPDVDFSLARGVSALIGTLLIVLGLILGAD